MTKKVKFQILEIKNSSLILFRSNYSWKICLNADSENSGSHNFSLFFDNFNINKIGKIFPESWEKFSKLEARKKTFENLELRNYQKEDVRYLRDLKSVAIFNEMRTGKTPTSLILCKEWLVNRIFIICPSVLQNQWQKSIEDWLNTPSYVVSYLSSEDRKFIYEKFFNQNDIAVIISKDVFKNDCDKFNEIRKKSLNSVNFCVVVDESHFLRNYRSQQSLSIYSLSDVNYKIVLTGTPFVNKYSDMFGILKFLYPSKYRFYWKFVNEYFNVKEVSVKKGEKKIFIKSISGFKSWQSRLNLVNEISKFSVRRKQSDILPWIPKVIYQKEFLTMHEEQQRMYEKWLSDKKDSPEKLFNLKSIILYPPYLDESIKTSGAKIDYLVSFCLENLDKQIVIFSTRSGTFLDPLSLLLLENGLKFAMITGKTPHEERIKNVENFQNFKIKLLLCNILSAGFGLELSSADTLIFADRSYSPADNDQAESRFLPVKPESNQRIKLIIDLVCKNTVDEKIIKLLEKKKNIITIMNIQPSLIFDN